MRYLSQGLESRKKIELLLKTTRMGEAIQAGIIDHLVNNFSVSDAARLNSLKSNNLSVAVKDLNATAEIFERLYELKVYELTNTNRG